MHTNPFNPNMGKIGAMIFYKCLRPTLCMGGNQTSLTICAEGRGGPLCSTCVPGYTSLTSDGACTICKSQSSSWATTVIFTLILLTALGNSP
jgi:hypothetical protein